MTPNSIEKANLDRPRFSGLLETSSVDLLDVSPDSPSGGIVSNELPAFDEDNEGFIRDHQGDFKMSKKILERSLSSIVQKPQRRSLSCVSESNFEEYTIRNTRKSSEDEVLHLKIKQSKPQISAAKVDEKIIEKKKTSEASSKLRSFSDSTLSLYDVNIDSAKKKIGASSLAFMEHLRGAANRRKDQVIRDRDSLVAKQKGMKETAEKGIVEEVSNAIEKSKESFHSNPQKIFFSGKKSRSITKSATNYRSGMIGIRKVERRKATTPVSPLLGKRRSTKPAIKALQNPACTLKKCKSKIPNVRQFNVSMYVPKKQTRSTPFTSSFRARPVPSGFSTKSGPIGIPKVTKRPVTIAVSPLLGVRRTHTSHNLRPSALKSEVSSQTSSLTLLGLNLLSPDIHSHERINVENRNPNELKTPKVGRITPFILHSTKRAKQRAGFDKRKLETQRRNTILIERRMNREINFQRKQLSKLRLSLK
eukprot:CAMPEP_0194141614 /NCGR_PEP_ID=MMETSP0152-20130528/11018_1 /TAXON_ID=1049557 /ORGANISM="Thalassiothrix antarctica, Strain L6-D1" /LENGTH=476 /DNA_ID=CAMNT_0038840301 /DNA_START=72 /DNA_END=1502 /DNA_ORIENTATION=+